MCKELQKETPTGFQRDVYLKFRLHPKLASRKDQDCRD